MRRIGRILWAARDFEISLIAKPSLWYIEKMGWRPALERAVRWLNGRLGGGNA